MKKSNILNLATLVALAALVFASALANAQSPTTTAPVVNSENAARVFLGSEISHFIGSFGCWLKSTSAGNPDAWEHGDFRMSPDGSIYELSLNGVPVDIDPDKPLAGLPYPTTGIRTQFHFFLNAFDKHGKFLASGNFGTTVLKKGDPIIVKLEAATVPNFIRFVLPAGVNPNNLILENTEGVSWTFDTRAGGFNIYSDPISGMGYRIIDQGTDIVYGVGHVPPFEEPVSANESLITLQYEGNVSDLPFSPTRRYVYRQAQKLDGSITNAEGNLVPAKVYMARLGGNSLSVYVNSVRGKVIVKQWVEEGELPVIAEGLTTTYPDDNTSSGGVSIPAGYDRVIIEVVGELENPDGFNTSISSFPEGDGGKG